MDKPKLFRKNIFLTLLQIKSLEQLSEYDGMDISEHLRQAVVDYLKKQKFDFPLPKETDLIIKFTQSVSEPSLPGSHWITGEIEKYSFSVLLLGEKSKLGMERGRIYKLSIWDPVLKESTNNFLGSCIVNYDRGWDIRPSKSAQPYFNRTKLWIEDYADEFVKTKI